MRDDDEDRALGDRPAEDQLVLDVARSRIANALFATDERVQIGRYQLLQRAGAGGMGAVWSAWDPELERRVAIKVMHVRSAAARDYIQREGQALAKLSHPNIVPIYDVGTVDDRVYLVMEWIAGVTLRAYVAEPRRPRDVIAIYLAAGAGVAAAHAAGIVQRDFKPDNVMVGDGGRVRVVDFGLAHASDRATGGSTAGTPRYMAPEQARGEPATPAADQYSFGVSLRESLGEPPAWVAAVIARATQVDPAARFPDMAALLAALARDPARVWRRRALAAGAVVALAAAFAIGSRRDGDDDACSGAAGELAQVWNPSRAATVVAHLHGLGPYGAAQAPLLAQRLTAYGETWIEARGGACRAQRRDDLTPALYEHALACFERSRAALDAVATTLGRTSTDRLETAVLAARNLPAADRCVAEATTDRVPPAPFALAARVSAIDAEVTRASYLALAGDPAALAIARPAVRDAEATGYAPLIARAQIALGRSLEPSSEAGAAAAYATAGTAALAGNDDARFVEAFARRLFAAAGMGDPRVPELVAAVPFVETIGKRTGDAGRFARALLYNNAGTERLTAGDRAAAIAWFRKARDEPPPMEPAPELRAVLSNLAMVVPDRAERDALVAEARAQLEQMLGADHASVFAMRVRAAMVIEDPRVAIARLSEVCDRFDQLHPHNEDVVTCHYELAWLLAERGDPAARERYRRVAALVPETTPGKVAAAASGGELGPALAVARKAETELWWKQIDGAEAWIVIAAVRDAGGDRAGAVAAWRSAYTMFAEVARHSSTTLVLRRRARAAALLALATRDRALAGEAIAWYRGAGGYDAMIGQLSW